MSVLNVGRGAVAALLLVTLAACASKRGGPIAYDQTGFGVPDPQTTVLPEDYTIAAGDKLRITVFQVEDLSREYEVDLSGTIAMPLIGQVKAVGSTTSELRAAIAGRLGERYMKDPDVTVALVDATARNVTVDGSVRQPGAYPVRGPMTLMEAVALARGTDENANPRRIAVFRRIEGQRMAAAFDLVTIRRGESPDPEIYAGDIVVVDGDSRRSVFREIFGTLPILALFRPY